MRDCQVKLGLIYIVLCIVVCLARFLKNQVFAHCNSDLLSVPSRKQKARDEEKLIRYNGELVTNLVQVLVRTKFRNVLS